VRIFRADRKKRWLERLPKRVSSAALILEDAEERVLVVKANYKPYWTFPGGIIDPDETPKQAAAREAREEIGIHVELDKLSFVSVANRSSSLAQTYQFIFKTSFTSLPLKNIILQATEIDEYAVVTKAQVLSGDRTYAIAVEHWAKDITGYIEQVFEK